MCTVECCCLRHIQSGQQLVGEGVWLSPAPFEDRLSSVVGGEHCKGSLGMHEYKGKGCHELLHGYLVLHFAWPYRSGMAALLGCLRC